MSNPAGSVRDIDHVVLEDGRIYRVVGNLDHPSKFVGYNVYSPDPEGDRIFRGKTYRKNFTEDDELPEDALSDTYVMLPKARICEHVDPVSAAVEKAGTFANSPWAGLHSELMDLFGHDAVGIFGSSMFGMHLTPDGNVRKDVDFVIEGTGNIGILRDHLPGIRRRLGFTEVSSARQGRQYERYKRVFRNDNNSTDLVIRRRWTALQAPGGIVTTIRFRDPAVRLPYQLAGAFPVQAEDITVTGTVARADLANLFPRVFLLDSGTFTWAVHVWWWKFASPVRDGDTVTVCGSRGNLPGHPVLRVTNFARHWLRIQDQDSAARHSSAGRETSSERNDHRCSNGSAS